MSIYIFEQSEADAYLKTIAVEVEHHVDSQAEHIRQEIRRNAVHINFLANNNELIAALESGDKQSLKTHELELQSFARFMNVYDQVRVLDRSGIEVIRINNQNGTFTPVASGQLQDKSKHSYFTSVKQLRAGEIFISRFDLNIEHAHIERPFKPMLRFSAPIINANGEFLGALVLNYLGELLFQHYLKGSNIFGNNILTNSDGYILYSPRPEVQWGSILPERSDFTVKSMQPKLWKQVIEKGDGQYSSNDRLFTFATISPYDAVEQTRDGESGAQDWFIITEVNTDEIYGLPEAGTHYYTFTVIALLILWGVVTLLWLRSEGRREKTFNELENTLQEKRLLLSQQIHIQENERRFLAHTLHDDMGQALAAIQAYVAFVARACRKGLDESVLDGVNEIKKVTQQMQRSIRCQINDLRPAALDRVGLKASIQTMLLDFCKREGISPSISIADHLPELGDEENIHIYRIFQEALTNIAKYAEASQVSASINATDTKLFLEIADNGKGMSAESGNGIGLIGMKERVELLHGKMVIQTEPGLGLTIRVSVPLNGG